MARETLEAVKQMELKAAKIESQASNQYDEIVLSAEEQAKITIKAREKEAFIKADSEMKNAKKLGDEIVEKSIKTGNKEKENLTKKAKDNEKKAIELILSQIL